MEQTAVLDAPAPYVSKYPPRDPNKPRPKRINYALGAVLVSKGFTYDEAAKQTGAKSGKVLQVGLRRKGITSTASRAMLPSMPERVSITAKLVSDASDAVREKLNGSLLAQADKLSAKPVGKLASKGQGEAAVLKTMAETWRTLNGNPDQISITFGANRLDEGPDPQPVVDTRGTIEVESTPTPQAIE